LMKFYPQTDKIFTIINAILPPLRYPSNELRRGDGNHSITDITKY
jgi:hypothetical protein